MTVFLVVGFNGSELDSIEVFANKLKAYEYYYIKTKDGGTHTYVIIEKEANK